MLELVRALRAEGLYPAQVRVGDVHVELVAAGPMPTQSSKPRPVTRNDVVSEYGGPAIASMFDEGSDDDLVPAVKS